MCNKNFSCSLSHVLRHADSTCHKNNIRESTSLSLNNDNNVRPNKTIPRKCFQQHWLEIDLFKPWLREVSHDVNSFFCTFCNTSVIGGLSQIYRHAETIKHKTMCKTNKTNESSEDVKTNDEPILSFEKRKKLAEKRYAALIVDKNISHQTAKEILTLFQEIGKDYNVLKKMNMGRTKCTNIISNVLCPVETDRVVSNIQNTKFSIFIDETSDILNEKWMTFLVRYVDPKTLNIRSQLVKLFNIDARDCSAEKLFHAFKSEMLELNIPFLNIIALSCDNTSVMIGKHSSFKKKLEEICKNLITLACPCHSIALAAHVACAEIPDYCQEFFKKIANFISSNLKCLAVYGESCECFQKTNRKMLKSDTQWLSHHSCIEKLLESWDIIKQFLNESEKTKSETYLLSMIQKLDIKAYLLFLKHILHFLNLFNSFFQTEETRIHLLQPKSIELLTTVSKHFLKSEFLNHLCDSVKFTEKRYQKSLEEVHLGFECENYLDELIREGHVDIVINIRENCLQFYETVAKEISKKLPINDKFLSKLKVLQSDIAILDTNRERSFNDVLFIAETLGAFDENGLRNEWLALYLDFTITEKKKLLKLNFDDMWKQILLSKYPTNIDKYPNLKCLLNAVRSLPNSNVAPERMFSVLTDLKTKKRNKLSSASINAICVFKSALKTKRETVLDMEIDAKHLSLMSSDKLYNSLPKKRKNSITADVNNIAGPSSSNDIIMFKE
ncbi:hypothetical protein ACFW04_006098 [Cataglyphis niger]